MPRGFLLDSALRPGPESSTIELWGVLDDGQSFLARLPGVGAGFFVESRLRSQVDPRLARPEPTALRTMAGQPVDRIDLANPGRAAELRAVLEASGIQTHEADLRPTARFLLERGLRGGVELEGPCRPGERVARVFDAPSLAPAELTPELRVLALDIETDPRAERLLSFALHGAGVAEVHLLREPGAPPATLPAWASEHEDEGALLRALERRLLAADPDVLTGWNVIAFDLEVIERRARARKVTLRLGRGTRPLRVRVDRSFWGASRAEIEGRVVLDGVALLRGAFFAVEDHRLETVARAVLGEGKLLHGTGRGAEIERLFREDRPAFVAYNLRDAELVTRILETTGLVRLAVRRSLLTGMPLDRVSASIASFDALYLPELHRRGHVAPNVAPNVAAAGEDAESAAHTLGGAVLEPVTGIHDRVLAFDFKSLYPSLMRTFNIDPLTHLADPAAEGWEGAVVTPAGERFLREPGILPAILARLMAVREAAKREGDSTASQATKILMNSFYGVMASPQCRFHSRRLANAITGTGQALLFWTRDRFQALGHPVLYGDTDSLFVRSGAGSDAEAHALGRALAARVNADLAAHLRSVHGVESRLELELDGLWRKLFFPHVRHGSGGARKRYAGLFDPGSGAAGAEPRLVFVGMESVRRDWTAAAKEFQRGLYQRAFAGAPIAPWVREFLRALAAGEHDHGLVYKKALRKDLREYTATTPPHVRAARLGPPGARLIEYVMTTAGPEPIADRRHPLDYPHYVERQIRPIAEALLPELGLDWPTVTGEPHQPGLFGS